MRRWEYLIDRYEGEEKQDAFTQEQADAERDRMFAERMAWLNARGAERWELISHESVVLHPRVYISCVFKREVKQWRDPHRIPGLYKSEG